MQSLRIAREVAAASATPTDNERLRVIDGRLNARIAILNRMVAEERARIFGTPMSDQEVRRFAKLLVDPSLVSPLRASARSASVLASSGDAGVALQLNVCDIYPRCGRASAAVTVSGPLNSESDFSDLADLTGLAGTTKLAFATALNATNAINKTGLTFSAAVGRPLFTFSDAALVESERRHWIYKTTVGSSWKSAKQSRYVNYTYAVAYADQTATAICHPEMNGPVGALQCQDVRIGEPVRRIAHVAEFDYRFAFDQNVAARVVINRDLKNKVSGIAVPIYAFLNDSSSLAGGVRVDYRSDTKRWALSLFVGAFSL